MDLLSTIRKTGSRGGANFSWDDVATSSRRENYLGHSLKAPVGRWQKGRDLNWYASSESTAANSAETDEERQARERREELKKIKEAEEDAIARALGLPVKQRDTTGANSIEVEPRRQMGPASKPHDAEGTEGGMATRGDVNEGGIEIGAEAGAEVEAQGGTKTAIEGMKTAGRKIVAMIEMMAEGIEDIVKIVIGVAAHAGKMIEATSGGSLDGIKTATGVGAHAGMIGNGLIGVEEGPPY